MDDRGAATLELDLAAARRAIERMQGLFSDQRVDRVLADLGVPPGIWRLSGEHVHLDLDGVPWQIFVDGGLVQRVEAFVAARWLDDPWDEAATDDAVDEAFEWFEQVTGEARGVLGEPQFSDGAAADRFPDDLDADWASVWHLPGWRVLVLATHDDRELPYLTSVAATPTTPDRTR